MLNICYREVPVVESVANETRQTLCADGLFYCVQELEVGLFEYILEELAINEIVHAFEHCDPQGITSSFCLVPESCVEFNVWLKPIRYPERDDT